MICNVEDCTSAVRTRGLCSKHYQQWQRHGGLPAAPSIRQKRGEECSISDCEDEVLARGWCQKHYLKWYKHGDATWQAPRWKLSEEQVTYIVAHQRVRAVCGLPSEYRCITCGAQAQDWACWRNKTAVDTLRGYVVYYSRSVENYAPLCKRCHQILDVARGEKHPRCVLTDEIVLDLRERERIAPLNRAEEARRLGVSVGAVSQAISGATWKHLPLL